jgi:hypothetical protein
VYYISVYQEKAPILSRSHFAYILLTFVRMQNLMMSSLGDTSGLTCIRKLTGKFVGCALRALMTQELTAQALRRAVRDKRPKLGLIHHSMQPKG